MGVQIVTYCVRYVVHVEGGGGGRYSSFIDTMYIANKFEFYVLKCGEREREKTKLK